MGSKVKVNSGSLSVKSCGYVSLQLLIIHFQSLWWTLLILGHGVKSLSQLGVQIARECRSSQPCFGVHSSRLTMASFDKFLSFVAIHVYSKKWTCLNYHIAIHSLRLHTAQPLFLSEGAKRRMFYHITVILQCCLYDWRHVWGSFMYIKFVH